MGANWRPGERLSQLGPRKLLAHLSHEYTAS